MRDALATSEGDVVKTIGDAVMVRMESAGSALELGLLIVGEMAAEHRHPAVRVGMHHGPAVERNGDYFGATVNIAARVSAMAAGGEVLVTEAVRVDAGELDGVRYIRRGEHRLRNVSEPVTIFAVQRSTQPQRHGWPIDPVCQMAIEPGRGVHSVEIGHETYVFCSRECADRFSADPHAYQQ